MSRRGRRRVKRAAQVSIAPQKVWRPRLFELSAAFASYLQEEGLELEAVEVLETGPSGAPGKCRLRLRSVGDDSPPSFLEAQSRESIPSPGEPMPRSLLCPCQSGKPFGECHGAGGTGKPPGSDVSVLRPIDGEAGEILQELLAPEEFPVGPSDSDLAAAEEIVKAMPDTPATWLALARLRAMRGRA